jgi:hypothetical protein
MTHLFFGLLPLPLHLLSGLKVFRATQRYCQWQPILTFYILLVFHDNSCPVVVFVAAKRY